MQIPREFIVLIAMRVREREEHFRIKGNEFAKSQFNRESTQSWLEEANRLRSIRETLDTLLAEDRQLYTIQ